MEKICGIYKFTNKVNGKVYIGQSVDIYKRRKGHLKESKKNPITPFHKALNKYGLDGFNFDILIECPIDDLNYWEIFYIRYYNSNRCKGGNGYNMTDGGDGITSNSWTPEMREHQRVLYKDKPRAGNPEDWKWSDESKENQSIITTNYFSIQENRDKASEIAYKKYEEHPEIIDKIANTVSDLWKVGVYNSRKSKMEEYYNDPNWHGNSETLKKQFEDNPELKDRCKTCTGRVKITNDIDEKTVRIEEVEIYKSMGWRIGRLKKHEGKIKVVKNMGWPRISIKWILPEELPDYLADGYYEKVA